MVSRHKSIFKIIEYYFCVSFTELNLSKVNYWHDSIVNLFLTNLLPQYITPYPILETIRFVEMNCNFISFSINKNSFICCHLNKFFEGKTWRNMLMMNNTFWHFFEFLKKFIVVIVVSVLIKIVIQIYRRIILDFLD